ncbi:transmembrane protein 71 isoform X4 [Neofelis nebulosa]|uniref:transmembrane protein 71 isoform X4 n=1 Tax=Neofelis nebulosa TaxID=61452 RepID=UPI00272CC2FE|nr:transmembrane protein 71 isoform X4 [Neofelis nebulosa]
MYRISQLMSTPVASKCFSGSERRYTREPSPRCLFPSFACDFLDGDSSFEGCSAALLTGSHVTCRRSPRLLSNGYYVWTEDPLLCDKDGNITLSPPQASVLYKENLVRVFRKKKRIRPSFSDLFSLGASKSWQHGNIFGDVDSSLSEDTWLEGVGRLDTHHCNDIGFHPSVRGWLSGVHRASLFLVLKQHFPKCVAGGTDTSGTQRSRTLNPTVMEHLRHLLRFPQSF